MNVKDVDKHTCRIKVNKFIYKMRSQSSLTLKLRSFVGMRKLFKKGLFEVIYNSGDGCSVVNWLNHRYILFRYDSHI